MPTFFNVRFEAAHLASNVRQSLFDEGSAWNVENDLDEGPTVTNGKFHITVTPRALRIIDRINLYADGAEIWLPLISRLRLRGAARLLLARHADMLWQQQQAQEQPTTRQARTA